MNPVAFFVLVLIGAIVLQLLLGEVEDRWK